MVTKGLTLQGLAYTQLLSVLTKNVSTLLLSILLIACSSSSGSAPPPVEHPLRFEHVDHVELIWDGPEDSKLRRFVLAVFEDVAPQSIEPSRMLELRLSTRHWPLYSQYHMPVFREGGQRIASGYTFRLFLDQRWENRQHQESIEGSLTPPDSLEWDCAVNCDERRLRLIALARERALEEFVASVCRYARQMFPALLSESSKRDTDCSSKVLLLRFEELQPRRAWEAEPVVGAYEHLVQQLQSLPSNVAQQESGNYAPYWRLRDFVRSHPGDIQSVYALALRNLPNPLYTAPKIAVHAEALQSFIDAYEEAELRSYMW